VFDRTGSFHRTTAVATPDCPSAGSSAADNRSVRALRSPLLCELHAHTTWSDGQLSAGELVDLYGGAGFDVLCITDHVVRGDDPHTSPAQHVHRDNHADYLGELEREARRARERYDLLVIPGLELTYNDADPARSAHALALGLRSFLPVDEGIEGAMRKARAAASVVVAAHPYTLDDAQRSERGTARFSLELAWAASLAHRFELFNRHDFFPFVAEHRLPGIATGDFHRPEHLATWKTLVPCQKREQAVLDYLRSPRPAYIAQLTDRLAA
jgi:hypothetical protein